MKAVKPILKTLCAVAFMASALGVVAQPGKVPPPPPRGTNNPVTPTNNVVFNMPKPAIVVALDANRDGKIDRREITNAPTRLATLDINRDGQLTRLELCPELTNSVVAIDPNRPVPPLIAAMDTNADGTLSASEIANSPASLRTLDTNSDGVLTGNEFMPPPPPSRPGGRPSR